MQNICFQRISLDYFSTSFTADIEPLQTNLDLEEGYCKALLCRLRFRKVLPCVYSLFIAHHCSQSISLYFFL